jgi:hypothetical protein
MGFVYPTAEQEQQIIDSGYKKELFFYQTGGGEDENDMYIFVNKEKDIAVAWDVWKESWAQIQYSSLNYVNGFNSDNAEPFNL